MKPVLNMHEGCLKYEGSKHGSYSVTTNGFVLINYICHSIGGLVIWDKYDGCIYEDC